MTGESESGTMVEGYWQGKTEILGVKPVPMPLFLKLPEGTEDNHNNFSQYICMYPPPPPTPKKKTFFDLEKKKKTKH